MDRGKWTAANSHRIQLFRNDKQALVRRIATAALVSNEWAGCKRGQHYYHVMRHQQVIVEVKGFDSLCRNLFLSPQCYAMLIFIIQSSEVFRSFESHIWSTRNGDVKYAQLLSTRLATFVLNEIRQIDHMRCACEPNLKQTHTASSAFSLSFAKSNGLSFTPGLTNCCAARCRYRRHFSLLCFTSVKG